MAKVLRFIFKNTKNGSPDYTPSGVNTVEMNCPIRKMCMPSTEN